MGSPTAVAVADPPQTATVLVVDDNASKRLGVRAMLAPLGLTVIEADSGRAALRAVATQRFAVILMDVRMPTLDGYATAKLIRQRVDSGLTPIIFFTAFGLDESETLHAYNNGAVDFIFTPVLADVLRAKVSAFVSLFEQARELQESLTAITALNEALQEGEVRAHAVVQNVTDGIVTADGNDLIESFNRAAEGMFGYAEEEVVGRPLSSLVAPGERERIPAATEGAVEEIATVGSRKDGTSFDMEMSLSRVKLGERTVNIASLRDVTGRKAYTDALEQRSLHDEATGLPNRALFGDRMAQAIAYADRAEEPRAVLVVDMDHFGDINKALGHDRGDVVLRAIAARLRAAMRDSDTVARVGGDEFAILPAGATDVEAAVSLAWRVREVFEQPFLVQEQSVDVQASVGIAFFPQHGRSTDELLAHANVALEEAKLSKDGIGVFAVDPEDRTRRRITLLSDLRDGIPRGELVLHYQPKIDLTGGRRTTGVEALVRWNHPTDGLLMPDQFLPDAERSELIFPLTAWVLEEALRQQRRWSDAGIDMTMAVNISARSLGRGSDLPALVERLTDSLGTSPGRLVLELTESSLIDAHVPDTLDRLHAMGESLSIDDFGTGHSSFVYLQRLPIDQVKIDRSFVMNLATVPNDAVIVRATIDLAHNLGLSVVAEGVEDEVALEMLEEYGCDRAQGYLFSRPCPADELTVWLAESSYGAPVGALH